VPLRGERTLYALAAAVYTGLGVLVPELLFSWIEAAVLLLAVVWLLPAGLRRLR